MTPIEAVRSALGEPFKSEAKCREVVRAVLLAVREPSEGMVEASSAALKKHIDSCTTREERTRMGGHTAYRLGQSEKARIRFTAMIDALLVEVEKG